MTAITDYDDVTHGIVRETWQSPDGRQVRPTVDNPNLSGGQPEYLRVALPSDGMNFKVIQLAHEHGLVVADVWQLSSDRQRDQVMIRLVPAEEADNLALEGDD